MMKVYRVHYIDTCVHKDKTIGYYTTVEKAKEVAKNTFVGWDDGRPEVEEVIVED